MNKEYVSQYQKIIDDLKEEYALWKTKHTELVRSGYVLNNTLSVLTKLENEARRNFESETGECIHKWDYTGSDSHKDYFECKKCGKETWE